MTQALQLFAALLIGVGGATQTAMLGAVGRDRGSGEATWISVLATMCGLAILIVVRAVRGDGPMLPAPLDRGEVFAVVALVAGATLVLSMRGIAPYYAVTGLFGLAYIVGAAVLAPRLGVALFVSAIIAGQLIGAVALDQVGAFGIEARRIDAVRVLGIGALLLGVVLVRGR